MSDEIVARNALHLKRNLRKWMRNLRLNSPIIESEYQIRSGKINYTDVPFDVSGGYEAAAIIASGYSLTNHKDWLFTWDAPIIASPTNLPWLLQTGISPDIVLISDPQDAVYNQLLDVEDYLWHLNFIVPTFVSNKVLDLLIYQGAKVYFYNAHIAPPSGNMLDEPYNFFVNNLFADLSIGWMAQVGCVTNAAVNLAARLNENLKAIFLVGAEYSFPDPLHSRVPMYSYDKEVPGEPVPKGYYDHPLYHVLVTDAMLAYKRTLMTLWYSAKYPLSVLKTSDGVKGTLRELPSTLDTIPLDQAIADIVAIYSKPNYHEDAYDSYVTNVLIPYEKFHHQYSVEGDVI